MRLEITVDGRPALTSRMAAERYRELYGLGASTTRSAISRSGVQPIDPPPLHSRIPLYDLEALDAALAARPGKGANLRRPDA